MGKYLDVIDKMVQHLKELPDRTETSTREMLQSVGCEVDDADFFELMDTHKSLLKAARAEGLIVEEVNLYPGENAPVGIPYNLPFSVRHSQRDRIKEVLASGKGLTQAELSQKLYGDKKHGPNLYASLKQLVESGEVLRRGLRPAVYVLRFKDGDVYLRGLIERFIIELRDQQIELYNEVSLQLELGVFLRSCLPDYKVQFERNVSSFGITGTVKKEIDIVICNNDESERYAIEIKYPRNGQYPEEMYSFIEDIAFMEELKSKGFNQTAVLTLVDDKVFYEGRKTDGIYGYFRKKEPITRDIYKPTGAGKNSEHLTIQGRYQIEWSCIKGERRYYSIVMGD